MPRTAAELIKELDHPIPETRKQCGDELVAMGPAVEPFLTEALERSQNIKVRRRLLLILGAIKAPKAIPALMEYVKNRAPDGIDDTRGLAMRAILAPLEPKHTKYCFDFFLELRRDPDASVRMTALEGLAKLGDPRALPFLEKASQIDEEQNVRDLARRLSVTFVKADGAGVEELYTTTHLGQKLASRDAFQRNMAIDELLKRSEDPFAVFLEATRSEHALARQSGLMGLGRVGSAKAYELLLGVADHSASPPDERVLALRALASTQVSRELNLDAVYKTLDRHARNRSEPLVAGAALAAMAALPHPDAREQVAKALEDGDPWLRESAAKGLAASAQPSHKALVGPLGAALLASGQRALKVYESKQPFPKDELDLQVLLLQAMSQIAEPGSQTERAWVSPLMKFVDHPSHEIRTAAAELLGTIVRTHKDLAEGDVRDAIELLESRVEGTRQTCVGVLQRGLSKNDRFAAPLLASLTFRADAALVAAIIPMLAIVDDPEARSALSRLSTDPRTDLAQLARTALLTHSDGSQQ
ncbi:MAG: hypothetical protein AUK47_09305 [Deltaproteobacteria bacterium CG2_30_63_29]|nr:MAG: hypothetical protein AUK47_09305 [Deltaproteobacteria bacterium CG2_30_63_29]